MDDPHLSHRRGGWRQGGRNDLLSSWKVGGCRRIAAREGSTAQARARMYAARRREGQGGAEVDSEDRSDVRMIEGMSRGGWSVRFQSLFSASTSVRSFSSPSSRSLTCTINRCFQGEILGSVRSSSRFKLLQFRRNHRWSCRRDVHHLHSMSLVAQV